MARYHLSAHGDPRPCTAEKRPCPLGFGPEEHYATREEALAAYEAKHQDSLFTKLRRSPLKKFTLAGGALVASFSLTACGELSTASSPAGQTPTSAADVLKGVVQGGASGAASKASEEVAKHQEALQKAKQAGEDATAYVKDHKQELKDAATTVAGAGKEALQQVQQEVATQPAPVSPAAGRVLFQGKPLTVTHEELSDALSKLKTIPVRQADTTVDYNRMRDYGPFKAGVEAFLEHRDIPNATFASASKKARAVSGNFIDPYTGKQATVVPGSNSDTDADHIVTLEDASYTGTKEWLGLEGTPQEKADAKAFRQALANDPDNLIVVSSSINRSKGPKDAASFVPPYAPSDCRYAMAVVTVKAKNKQYLAVTPAEKAKLSQILQTQCKVAG